MITYDFQGTKEPLYLFLYRSIKKDILSGKLRAHEKLPSKRTFARNNGISTITIQNAYDQLISEGYIYTVPKKGYYVSSLDKMVRGELRAKVDYNIRIPSEKNYEYDLSSNRISPDNFPFSIWNRLSREIMNDRKEDLMRISPTAGIRELREAIASHLKSFRGMLVDPDQIVIGSGTEYFYGLIVQLLGRDRIYVIENPGYKKLEEIYKKQDVCSRFASLDEKGVTVEELERTGAEVAHICPNHHFPTGITMPASRRYEILSWANSDEGRYIIEDDYDSEFRITGKPIPPLFSIDACEKVIYINTFSKTLSPTIRVSYMVLPVHLANLFYKTMSFYACTVSNFEQYTLYKFISEGYLEKHINRMRLYYLRKRKKIMDIINQSILSDRCSVIENDSGLHFLIKIDTAMNDSSIKKKLKDKGIKLNALSEYYFTGEEKQHLFIVNYSDLDEDRLKGALKAAAEIRWS